MHRSATQAVHKDKVANGPANRFDELLFDPATIVQQRDVRRELRTRAYPRLPHCDAQGVMKHHYAIDIASATQNQCIAADEARNAIELDLEWHRRYRGAGLYRFGNDA